MDDDSTQRLDSRRDPEGVFHWKDQFSGGGGGLGAHPIGGDLLARLATTSRAGRGEGIESKIKRILPSGQEPDHKGNWSLNAVACSA